MDNIIALPGIIPPAEIAVREWRGQRVVTLADIDRLHRRPEGTARRTFFAHQNRLTVEIDYFKASYADRQDDIGNISDFDCTLNVQSKGGPRGDVILVTQRGYLKLVKPFTDDLSWEIQDLLIEGYFMVKSSASPIKPATTLKYLAETIRATKKAMPPQADIWPLVRAAYQAAGIEVPEALTQIAIPTKPMAAQPVAWQPGTPAGIEVIRRTLHDALLRISDRVVTVRKAPWVQGYHLGIVKTIKGRSYLACNPAWIKDVLQHFPAEAALETLQQAGWLYADPHSISRVTKVGAYVPAARMIWVDMAFIHGGELETPQE